MHKAAILTALALIGSSLVLGAAAASSPTDELDIRRVVEAEAYLMMGLKEAEILDRGYSPGELEAAHERQRYSDEFADFDWLGVIGSDNYAGTTLRVDGSVLIEYVLDEPRISDLRPSTTSSGE